MGSSAARKALFEKSHWPCDVTVRVFKPTIPKGSGSRRDRGQRRDGNRTREGNRRLHGNMRHVADVRHKGDEHAHDTRNGDRVQRLYDENTLTRPQDNRAGSESESESESESLFIRSTFTSM